MTPARRSRSTLRDLAALTLAALGPAHAQVVQGSQAPLGLNVTVNEQTLVDLLPSFVVNSSSGADSLGWPTGDFSMYLDNRYIFAWLTDPTNADPLKKSTDLSGTYKLSFTGQGTVTDNWNPAGDTTLVTSQQYAPATNTTTADINITNPPGGPGELFFSLGVSNTKRTASSALNTGVTNLHLIRPGYAPGTSQIFTDLWQNSIKNYRWSALRFMGVLGTDDYAGAVPSPPGPFPYSTGPEAYPYLLNWATDRALPNAGPLLGSVRLGVHGLPWEDVILASNMFNTDAWVSVPVNASDDYVNQVALLLKNGDVATGGVGLKPHINLYLEYGNELWHDGYAEGLWNKAAMQAEVSAGGSNLNYDGLASDNPNPIYSGYYTARLRRIAKRTVEIGRQFRAVFSDNPGRVRPVINNASTGYTPDILTYVSRNYGPPSKFLYAISQTGYYSSADTSSMQAVLDGEKVSSDANLAGYLQSRAVATFFGLHSLAYEGGPAETGGLPSQFAAARDPGMQDVELHALDDWYPSGGELFLQFGLVGRYSTYGTWGLSDDLTNLLTGKWNGVTQIMSTPTPSVTAGTALAATVGQSVSVPAIPQPNIDLDIPSDAPWQMLLVSAPVPGAYTLTLAGRQGDPADSQQVWVDNKMAGTTSLPTAADGPSWPVRLTLQPGLHAVFVYALAPARSYNNPFDITTQPGDAATVTLSSVTNAVPTAPRLATGTAGLFRAGSGALTITLPVLNVGQSAAGSVTVSAVTLGKAPVQDGNTPLQAPVLPDVLGDIPAGGRAPVAITVSRPPTPGTIALLTVRGTYRAGGAAKTFSFRQYIRVP